MASKHKPTPERPVMIARAVLTKLVENWDMTEIWNAGDYCFGLQILNGPIAGDLLKRGKFAPGAEETLVRFPNMSDSWEWFQPNLHVGNHHWLEVTLGDEADLHDVILDRLTFDDDQSVDLLELAATMDVMVDERMFDSLEGAVEPGTLVYKPVRVDGSMVVGYRRRNGKVALICFNDDWNGFTSFETYASFSWFMDDTGAPISWSGGRQLCALDADGTILAIDLSGDDEDGRQVWEKNEGETISSAIYDMFVYADPPSDHFLFLGLGLTRHDGIFSDEEWETISVAAEMAKGENGGTYGCHVQDHYIEDVKSAFLGTKTVYSALVSFITVRDFPHRSLVLKSWSQLVRESNGYVWREVLIDGKDFYGALSASAK